MKHLKLFEFFGPFGDADSRKKCVYLGFSQYANGYCAGVVTQEQGEMLVELFGGECEPLANNVYAYINLEQTQMSAEDSRFNIEGLSFVSADGEDNYFDDEEPDYNKLVIELPKEGIMVTYPDQNGWNGRVMSVEEFIEQEQED